MRVRFWLWLFDVAELTALGVPPKRAAKVARREREIQERRGREPVVKPPRVRPPAPTRSAAETRRILSALAAFATSSMPTGVRRGR